MTNKIDQLAKDVEDIKKSLDDLKKNVSITEKEKKNKAEELREKVEKTKKEIESEIELLSNKTDDESKKDKEKAEALLSSCSEILDLYSSIINSIKPGNSGDEKKEDGKNIFSKTGGWIGDQWDCVWDKERRKTEGWKNLLRTSGFVASGVGLVALTYKLVKKLWNRMKKDDNEDDSHENGESSESESGEGKKSNRWERGLDYLFNRLEKKK